jgi:DNA-binding transcriptional LysR family regulator
MESLTDYRALVAVVEAGSFGAAARATDLPKSTLSRAVQRLEARLKTPLLERSGRHVVPTPAGVVLARRAQRALDLIVMGEAEARDEHRGTGGELRISVPVNPGEGELGELISDVLRRLPDVAFQLEATNRMVDLVDERVDIVVRAGRTGSGDWIATTLAETRWGMYAGRDGPNPHTAEQVADFPLLLARPGKSVYWPWTDPPLTSCRVRLISNDFRVLAKAAREGHGIAVIPDRAAVGLRQVLPHIQSDPVPLIAMWPPSRRGDPRIRAFVESARQVFGALPS